MVHMPSGSPNDPRAKVTGCDSTLLTPAQRREWLDRSIANQERCLIDVCRAYIMLDQADQIRLGEAMCGNTTERWNGLRRLPLHLRRFAMDALFLGVATVSVEAMSIFAAEDEARIAREKGN